MDIISAWNLDERLEGKHNGGASPTHLAPVINFTINKYGQTEHMPHMEDTAPCKKYSCLKKKSEPESNQDFRTKYMFTGNSRTEGHVKWPQRKAIS